MLLISSPWGDSMAARVSKTKLSHLLIIEKSFKKPVQVGLASNLRVIAPP